MASTEHAEVTAEAGGRRGVPADDLGVGTEVGAEVGAEVEASVGVSHVPDVPSTAVEGLGGSDSAVSHPTLRAESARLAVCEQVPIVLELGYVPRCMFLGCYGGGDGMTTARTILAFQLPPENIPGSLKERVVKSVMEVHEKFLSVPATERVASLPTTLPDLRAGDRDTGSGTGTGTGSGSGLRWSCRLALSSHVYGSSASTLNLMSHGSLFADTVKEPGRLGASKWPLIGVFDAVGFRPPLAEEVEVPFATAAGTVSQAAGVECLNPADQHVHLVESPGAEFDGGFYAGPEWHAGADMAKVSMDLDLGLCKAWAVCVDLECLAAEVTYLLVIHPRLEEAVERSIGACMVPSTTSNSGDSSDRVDCNLLLPALRASLGSEGMDAFAHELDAICVDPTLGSPSAEA